MKTNLYINSYDDAKGREKGRNVYLIENELFNKKRKIYLSTFSIQNRTKRYKIAYLSTQGDKCVYVTMLRLYQSGFTKP